MSATRPDPDPPIDPQPSARQSTKDDNQGRLKKISGGGANFSGSNATTKGIPHPNDPYSKG
jgi:hypothetical protein